MADNLLDKASILLTPTAYNDGSMLSIKPENGDGDFTFSRSSAATRVNAQGLVENVQIISSELVSNGNFSQIGTEEVSNGNFSQEGSELVTNGDFATDSDWNIVNNTGTASEIINGYARIKTDGAYTQIDQPNVTIAAKSYKLQYTISESDGGSLGFIITGNQTASIPTTVGTHIYYFVANSTSIVFKRFSGVLDVKIDNISVKEVGQDWSLQSSASISQNKLIVSNAAQNITIATQSSVAPTQKPCKLQFDIVVNTGSFRILLGSSGTSTVVTESGTYTLYETSGNFGTLTLQARDGGFDGSITNISVKEVGQDWDLGSGWSIGDDKAISDGTTSNLQQFSVDTSVVGKKYKISLSVSDYLSGFLSLSVGGYDYASPTISSNGEYTRILEVTNSSSNDRLYIGSSSFNGSITNISVKEITDDTDLPRINYEGFSYQDSLGSEEVVNGDFSNGLTNWYVDDGTSWTNVNNTAFCDGNNGLIAQNHTLTQNKVYKVTFDSVATNSSGKELGVRIANGTYSWNLYPTGTHTIYLTAGSSGTQGVLFYATNGWTGSIDNVSVKEVLGQEVVPDSGCGSWLLEPQSTNLVTHSQSFTSGWSFDDTTITENSTISPSGILNGSLLKGSTISSRHNIVTSVGPGNVSATFSLFVKAKELKYIQIASANTVNQYVNFDTENGTIGTIGSSFSSAKIEDYGNGWYRISVISPNQYNGYYISLVSGLNVGWLESWVMPNNTDGLYIWGAQLEEGSHPTSYIPTSGATNTRLQDIATNSGNSTLINSTEGVLYAEIAGLSSPVDSPKNITISDGTASNYVRIEFYQDGKVYGNVYDGTSVSASFVINQDEYNKIAIQYSSSGSKLYVNGTGVNFASKIFTSNTLNTIQFSNAQDSASYFHGKAKALAVYKEALTDANLRSLTYPNPVATTFDLDFDTIAEQFTFTRGSEATFVNAQGLIESTASNDAPRIDYSTGAKAFLLEPQSTNLITQSELFSDSSWVKNGFGNALAPVVTLNSNISPDGTQNASRIEMDCASTLSSDYSAIYQQLALDGSSDYTISFYVKSNTSSEQDLLFFSNSSFSTQITANSEWQRVESTFTSNSTNARNFGLVARGSVQQDVDVLIYGAQLEQKSYATSYIPTSGASATRNQELCNNATPVINSEEGTLYAEISALANDGTYRSISISDSSRTNIIEIDYTNDEKLRILVKSANVVVFSVLFVLDITIYTKLAVKYKLNDFEVFINGIKEYTITNGVAPIGLSELAFDRGDGGTPFFGNTKGLKYYPKALADVQLEDLTTI